MTPTGLPKITSTRATEKAGAGGDGSVGRRLRRRGTAVLAVAAWHDMTELRVFGSVGRGQDTDSSVLGLLVRVAPGHDLLPLGRFTRRGGGPAVRAGRRRA